MEWYYWLVLLLILVCLAAMATGEGVGVLGAGSVLGAGGVLGAGEARPSAPRDPPAENKLAWLGRQMGKNKHAAPTYDSIWHFITTRTRHIPKETMGALKTKFRSWIQKGETDGRIVAALASVVRQFPVKEEVADKRAQGRALSRIQAIEDPLTALVLSSHFPPVRKYLDIGCGEGSLTGSIGAALGLQKESEIHGCDIFANKPSGLESVRFTYTTAHAEHLPYKDGEFQVVSCIMSLHHFASVEQSLKEIRRVLVPGGLLLIREHDSPNEYFGLFLDFVHYYYAGVGGEILLQEGRETEDFNQARKDRLIAWYRTESEWAATLKKAGFAQGAHYGTKDRFRSFYGFYRRT